ncbi:hypothetical protein [Clostridium sp. HBUAS56010]|uniref:hypothetical protein n=1 Tax=Clostridium sp. HBUAS56010 TaxID=2571127 RepID=UPI0011789E46|nr:hypothetical protein [Clostridium sp. HBUAS56010]
MNMGEKKEKDGQTCETGLLERIAAESGCMYLSDLRKYVFTEEFLSSINQIQAGEYPVKIWRDAFYYITGNDEAFYSSEEAKQQILRYIKGKKINLKKL